MKTKTVFNLEINEKHNCFIIISFSCKKKEGIQFYYPNKSEFLKWNKNSQTIKISSFKNVTVLIDSLECLKSKHQKAVLEFKKVDTTYSCVVSTFFDVNSSSTSPRIKYWNILSVSKDSIFKTTEFYAIYSLESYLKKDLLNNSKEFMEFADSPEKLSVSITEKLENLEPLLMKIFKLYNKIEKETKDSLQLNIEFNTRMEILPMAPSIL